MSRKMGEIGKTMIIDKASVIFADVQQEVPEYLCMDESGCLYLCTVGRQDGGFVERDTKIISRMEAFIFIANACNKARIFISENENVEE